MLTMKFLMMFQVCVFPFMSNPLLMTMLIGLLSFILSFEVFNKCSSPWFNYLIIVSLLTAMSIMFSYVSSLHNSKFLFNNSYLPFLFFLFSFFLGIILEDLLNLSQNWGYLFYGVLKLEDQNFQLYLLPNCNMTLFMMVILVCAVVISMYNTKDCLGSLKSI